MCALRPSLPASSSRESGDFFDYQFIKLKPHQLYGKWLFVVAIAIVEEPVDGRLYVELVNKCDEAIDGEQWYGKVM